MAAAGTDVDGEARFINAIVGRSACILDAGCGTGRIAAALVEAGHRAVGIDADPILVAAGRRHYPQVPLAELDLVQVEAGELARRGLPTVYDAVVAAGNVLLFVAEGTEHLVVTRLAEALSLGGRLVVGFHTSGHFSHDQLDDIAREVGLTKEFRFATWQCDPFTDDADWAVSVYRRRTDENQTD